MRLIIQRYEADIGLSYLFTEIFFICCQVCLEIVKSLEIVPFVQKGSEAFRRSSPKFIILNFTKLCDFPQKIKVGLVMGRRTQTNICGEA